MAKTLVAQNVANMNAINFAVDKEGKLTAITVVCEVNYGELGMMETVDVFPSLNDGEKAVAQKFYDKAKNKVEAIILG